MNQSGYFCVFRLAKEKCLLYILYTIYRRSWVPCALSADSDCKCRYLEATGSLKEVGVIA